MVEPRRVENWDWDDAVGWGFDVIFGLCFNAAQPRGEMQQPYRTRPNSVQYTRRKQRNVMVECMYYQHPTEQIAIYEQIKQPKVSNATTSIEISLSRDRARAGQNRCPAN